MERIEDLTKKKSRRRNLSKLKIDMSKPKSASIIKIAKYLAKGENEETLIQKFKSGDTFKHIKYDFEKFEGDLAKRGFRRKIVEGKEYTELKFTKINSIVLENAIYTVLGINIEDRFIKNVYRYPSIICKSKIIDATLLYGILKLCDEVYDYALNNKELITSEKFEKISCYNTCYEESNIEDVLNFVSLTKGSLNCVKGFSNFDIVAKLILDIALLLQNEDYNIELTSKYNSETNTECARAFETKKNIPAKVLNVMNRTSFLQDFRYVEIDSDTDLKKFHTIEREWKRVKGSINIQSNNNELKPELRFKKLGKHKALGLYYPRLRCICVDITSPASFMHEFGHYIDNTYSSGQLSMEMDFYLIIKAYKKAYEIGIKEIEQEDIKLYQYLNRKKKYFFTPTEIFARCFEMFLVNRGLSTSLLRQKSDFELQIGYPKFDNEFYDMLDEYYSNIINLDLASIEQIEKKVIKNVVNDSIEYVEPVISLDGQFRFAI